MKLHQLTAEYINIQDDEDLPPEAIADTLEGIEGEIQVKGENIALLVQNWEADIDTLDSYKKKLDLKIKQRKNKIEHLKNYLRENMEAAEIKKLTCSLFSITLIKPSPVVAIQDESKLPDEYVTVKVVTAPDKRKILEALKNGEEVKGAILGESKSGIRIK